jgi:hypothetical protein
MADKALLVGINNYPGCPLAGCVNDVQDMASLLVDRYKFKPEDVRLLCDERATTAAILDRLNWLVDVKPGDRCLFHYSGHGAQFPSRDYKQELDGLLEVICPVDFDWEPEHMITDKQFVHIFSGVPAGVKLNWISDSCHSGDLTRGLPKPGAPVNHSRAFPVPADIAWRLRGAHSRGVRKQSRAVVCGVLDVGFISGCRSDQTSADANINGRPGGALTQTLIPVIRRSGASAPLADVVRDTARDLVDGGYDQVPQCEGARAKKPFLG